VPLYSLFATTGLGYAFSLVGGRVGGELLRPALLGLREKVPISAAVGSIAIERLLDLVALVLLAAFTLLLPTTWTGLSAPEAAPTVAGIRIAGGFMLAGALVLLVLMALAASRREALEAWARRRSAATRRGRLLGMVLGVLGRFLQGAESLRSRRLLVSACLQSLWIWIVVGAGVWLMLLGCGVSAAEVPFLGVYILAPALALGIAVPTPGGAGGYHFAMAKTLEKLFGVPYDSAVAASLIHHAATWLPIILLAAVLMAREGLGMSDLSRLVREVRASSPEGGAR
jgi:uncharacterized protein (TIRG00374 family)